MASSTQYPQEVVLPTSYLLSQVASSVKSRAPTATAKISCRTTWTAPLQTAQRSLEQQDQQLVIFPKQTKERQQALKEMALSMRSTSADVSSRTSNGRTTTSENASSRTSDGNVPKHQLPPRSSPAVRERLRELAKENMAFNDRQPYHLQTTKRIASQSTRQPSEPMQIARPSA